MSSHTLQAAFFSQIADPQALRAIFEAVPDVYFFVKDRQSRLMAASSTILARLGMKSEAEFIGKMDADVFPPLVAKAYREDDQLVFRTGKPLVDRMELWYDESRQLDWCLTTKMPLRDAHGKVVGLMGLTRKDAGRQALSEQGDAAKAATFLRENVHRVMSTAELARAMSLSERSLNRKINLAYGVSPYELMLRSRVQAAAEALVKTNASLSEIALAYGFCDQSTFTQHFRRRLGVTPRQFRLRHQS
jgi:AraC-like DNA-binding protein